MIEKIKQKSEEIREITDLKQLKYEVNKLLDMIDEYTQQFTDDLK